MGELPELEHVRIEGEGAVRTLMLARPEKLNALALQTLDELVSACRHLDRQPEVRAVVVAGEGRVFCAGFDLRDDIRARSDEQSADDVDRGRRMADAVSGMRAVTVAAVQSHCVGGGVVLAASCDLRLATPHTSFVIPEVDIGIPLTWSGIPRLVRELGPARTRELVMTCRPFDAHEAHNWGFVNRVVPADALRREAEALAGEIASKPWLAVSFTKRQVARAAEALAPTSGSDVEARLVVAALRDPDSREHLRRAAQRRGGRS